MTGSGPRRLLAVSFEMPPLVGPRSVQVSRTLSRLAELGWTSTVVCAAPKPDGPLLRDAAGFPELPVAGVELERVPSAEEGVACRAIFRLLPPLARLPDRKRIWVGPAIRAAIRRASRDRFHALLSFAQPWSDHLIGLALHRRLGVPWVAHFSDPWTDSPYERGPRWLRRRWRHMEADVIRGADAIVFVNAHAADTVMRKYPDAWRRKVHVVPHGFDRQVLAGLTLESDRHRRLRLVYTGRFYDGVRTPVALFEALGRLNARRPLDHELEVRMVGPHVAPYGPHVCALGLSSIVSLTGRRPYVESLREAAAADALLVIDAPSETPSLFLPSKLIDYLVLRKPIIGLTPLEGASADLLRRLQCPVVAPDDVEGIARVMEQSIEDWRQGRLRVFERFDDVAREYDVAHTTQALAEVLDQCVTGGGRL